jgi:hypothetical protein
MKMGDIRFLPLAKRFPSIYKMFHQYWIILIIGFVLLWIFLGRKNTEFVGLNPLFSNQPLPQDPFRVHPFITDQLKSKKMIAPPPVTKKEPVNNRFNSKGQRNCCQIMEEIYGKPFSCARPLWLKNPETGGVLEIDCYNDELKIGVEYNGIQHYVYPNIYHKSLIEFKNQVRRDQFKLKKCEENGVYLISVPYNVPMNKMKDFIISNLPQNVQDDTDDFDELEKQVSMLSDAHKINIPTTVCYQEYLA